MAPFWALPLICRRYEEKLKERLAKRRERLAKGLPADDEDEEDLADDEAQGEQKTDVKAILEDLDKRYNWVFFIRARDDLFYCVPMPTMFSYCLPFSLSVFNCPEMRSKLVRAQFSQASWTVSFKFKLKPPVYN